MSSFLNFNKPPTPTAATTDITDEQLAKSLRGMLLKHGALDVARDHGLMPKGAVAKLADFITEDPEMKQMKQEVVQLADVGEPVIIFGESGTGKESIARALHGDKVGKFVAINCAAMPETLLESELFGHKAGSFTDAKQDKVGLLELATDGTIFLDEIGEMPLKLQAKLLRALQEQTIRRVGDNIERPIKCRVVSATNRELWKFEETSIIREPGLIGAGISIPAKDVDITESRIQSLNKVFRLDLYWRIAVYKLHITPLRYRREDIRELLDAKYDVEGALTEEEREEIISKPLYGNCRELEALVKRTLLRKSLSVVKKN